MRRIFKTSAAIIVLFLSIATTQAVTIDWVPVGNAGNDPDTRYSLVGSGAVDYSYRIGKYEVTNAQYAEMLNAVAAVSDANGLYSADMGGGWNDIGGISRTGSGTGADPWVYSARTNRAQRPVNYVSWYDTLRFANWLHNGQPSGGQDPNTTEDGAYDMSLGSGAVRKPGAMVFLPSKDEWYKAAYYDPDLNSGTGRYWNYPTQSNTPPTSEEPGGTDPVSGSANYYSVGYVDPIYYTTEVGAYNNKPSDSAYGTFDQAGNVWEWTEAGIFENGLVRGLWGGSFYSTIGGSQCDPVRSKFYLTCCASCLNGFRVANIPEPTTVVLGVIGLLCTWWWRL